MGGRRERGFRVLSLVVRCHEGLFREIASRTRIASRVGKKRSSRMRVRNS